MLSPLIAGCKGRNFKQLEPHPKTVDKSDSILKTMLLPLHLNYYNNSFRGFNVIQVNNPSEHGIIESANGKKNNSSSGRLIWKIITLIYRKIQPV